MTSMNDLPAGKVAFDSLLPAEKQAFEERGIAPDVEGLVDLDLGTQAPPSLTESEIRNELTSTQTQPVQQGPTQASLDLMAENKELKKELEAVKLELSHGSCNRCSWPFAAEHGGDVTEEDRNNFVESVLEGTSFNREYSLLGGKLVVQFTSLSRKQEKQAQAYAKELLEKETEGAQQVNTSMFLHYLAEVRFGMRLTKWNGKELWVDVPEEQAYQNIQRILLEVIPSQLFSTVEDLHRDFDLIISKLSSKALDEDFYSGMHGTTD